MAEAAATDAVAADAATQVAAPAPDQKVHSRFGGSTTAASRPIAKKTTTTARVAVQVGATSG